MNDSNDLDGSLQIAKVHAVGKRPHQRTADVEMDDGEDLRPVADDAEEFVDLAREAGTQPRSLLFVPADGVA